MKILVTGAKGMLGRDLCPVLEASHEVIGIDQEDADIRDQASIQAAVRDIRPELVLHAAAFTDVDAAEADPELARKINACGTLNVALAARDVDAQVAYMSTDYVFDGEKHAPYTEEDTPNPVNVYGRTKHAGERAITAAAEHGYIIRTAWLFAPHGRNFVNTIIRLAKERGRLEVVDDQVGTPTYTVDLAHAIAAILAAGKPGVYHVANAGPCSWFGFAAEILRQTSIQADLSPTTSTQFRRPARRPPYSALATDRLQRDIGHRMRPWQDALADCLKRKRLVPQPAASQPMTEGSQ